MTMQRSLGLFLKLYSVVVSTVGFDSSGSGSNLGGTSAAAINCRPMCSFGLFQF